MLFEPSRHQPLQSLPWDEARVRQTLVDIVRDTEAHVGPDGHWPLHPLDADPADPAGPCTPLYFGTAGVLWALHYLQAQGAVTLERDVYDRLEPLLSQNRTWLGEQAASSRASYLMGDTPILMMALEHSPTPALEAELAALIEGNVDHPTRELMWGAPGTLLAALFLFERTGSPRWAHLFQHTAQHLWGQLEWSETYGVHYWTQDLYGQRSTYLDAVHGFVATALVLSRGRALLPATAWQSWAEVITQTVLKTATWEGPCASWRATLVQPEGRAPRMLMQLCHGAPGFVVCLADMPSGALDPLLRAAGEAVWQAGPLNKGSNLCHGTGGNGYAFLKLYQRTGEARWLERARAFAMHGILQLEADHKTYRQGRYSLFTGDIGFVIYLWDCLNERAAVPTLDVFWGTRPVALS